MLCYCAYFKIFRNEKACDVRIIKTTVFLYPGILYDVPISLLPNVYLIFTDMLLYLIIPQISRLLSFSARIS